MPPGIAEYGMTAAVNKNIQRADTTIISLRFFMNENLMMMIPELM
jgi:flavin-binding protein dodecin